MMHQLKHAPRTARIFSLRVALNQRVVTHIIRHNICLVHSLENVPCAKIIMVLAERTNYVGEAIHIRFNLIPRFHTVQ